MDNRVYHLLAWLAAGNAVFRPIEATRGAEEAFRDVVGLLHRLRDQGLVTFLDGHVTRTSSGIYLMVGPVSLTPQGVAALEMDRRLGERPPPLDLPPWRS